MGGVEVSTDNGLTWHPASGRESWTYTWTAGSSGTYTLRSRAVDDSGNLETAGPGVTVTAGSGNQACPCNIWAPSTTPAKPAETTDNSAVEVGVKFRATTAGRIAGIRFYKGSTNTGTHVGHLWTRTGGLLATVTFTNETATGWQEARFATPVDVTPGVTYIASYHAPNGNYASNIDYFLSTGVDSGPLRALRDGEDGGNGLYEYGPSGTFPASTWRSENYWVDVVFETGVDTTAPQITSVSPGRGATNVAASDNVRATFSEGLTATTVNANTVLLRDPSGATVPASVTYDAASQTATLDPTAPLAASTAYTATVKGGSAGVKDAAGNALAADDSWTFTTRAATQFGCPCSIWAPSATPSRTDSDTGSVEVGVRFRAEVDGFITGLRFHKSTANTGTHVGHLWTRTGQLLATATFTNETASGWQQVSFATPVAVTANTTYVASYHAPNGRYSVNSSQFAAAGVDNPPLRALRDGEDGGNGVYGYGPSGTFPTGTYQSEGYWVDVVFETTTAPDTTPPTVTGRLPAPDADAVPAATNVSASFNESMNQATIDPSTFLLRDPSGALVPASVSYDSVSRTATLDPQSSLEDSTRYTATVKGGSAGVKDRADNALANDVTWSFTTAAAPGPGPDEGPGGPILVIAKGSNPFTRYYAEILRAEGLNAFTVRDIGNVTQANLAGFDVAILGDIALTAAQVDDAQRLGHQRRRPGRHAARQAARRPDGAHRRRRRRCRTPTCGSTPRSRPAPGSSTRRCSSTGPPTATRSTAPPAWRTSTRPRRRRRRRRRSRCAASGPTAGAPRPSRTTSRARSSTRARATRRGRARSATARRRSAPTICSTAMRPSTRSRTGSTSARSPSRRPTSSSACSPTCSAC